MDGIAKAEALYLKYGAPMIEKQFPAYASKIAVGIAGEGSSCYGYDDAVSSDHDELPGFCLWINEKTDKEIGKELRAAYAKLQPLMGYAPNILAEERRGVVTIPSFFKRFIGFDGEPPTLADWFAIPEASLSCATNGKVFRDEEGTFTAIRKRIRYFPEDVRLKKVAAHAALAAQAGQYNYSRCLAHGEAEAAQMALYEFVQHAIAILYALNFTYVPFYKWQFRKLRSLPLLGEEAGFLGSLLTEVRNARETSDRIEAFCARLVDAFHRQGLTVSDEVFLEAQAKELQAGISDPNIASLHLMAGV